MDKMNGCDRCAADRLGGSTYSRKAHDLMCEAALKPGATIVRDARNGSGPLTDLTTSDLFDLVFTYTPYSARYRVEFYRQLIRRCEEGMHDRLGTGDDLDLKSFIGPIEDPR